LNGRVIFYANSITQSMQRAMDEMVRRREKQIAYNKEHGITPASVVKKIKDIIESAEDTEEFKRQQSVRKENRKYEDMTEPQMIKEINKLDKAMHKAAKNLEFEEAAKIRDQIKYLKEQVYGANIQDRI
jgi:excinuclease ABC subunit B